MVDLLGLQGVRRMPHRTEAEAGYAVHAVRVYPAPRGVKRLPFAAEAPPLWRVNEHQPSAAPVYRVGLGKET